jgi:hypothetical protein
MSSHSFNDVYKKQTKTLLPATYKKAVINNKNVSAGTVDVYFSENPTNIIRSIPLAKHIDPTTIMPGQRCRVDLFNETATTSMVVAYVF